MQNVGATLIIQVVRLNENKELKSMIDERNAKDYAPERAVKKIGFLGDSITMGAQASSIEKRFTTVLCKKLGVQEENYGVGGTRIARQRVPSEEACYDEYFLLRAKKADDDLDYMFVMGGTNDYGHGDAPFGTDSDDTDDTFCGALNRLIDYLVKKYTKEKICFILPTYRYNEESTNGEGSKTNGRPMSDYRDQIKKTCDKFGVKCVNVCDAFPKPDSTAGDKYTGDGLHPNDYGYNCIAEKLYNIIKTEKLF